mgnify:FL=1
MKILISPAKKMRVDSDSLPPLGKPAFLTDAKRILTTLQAMPPEQLKALWGCSESLAAMNVERLRTADPDRALTPAILAYEGIQYQYMAPQVMESGQLEYIQAHLRILSGVYGVLRPFDAVIPYRLEMQAKLPMDGQKDLYGFWGGRLAAHLAAEDDCLLDLASKEYSRAVRPHLPDSVRWVECRFVTRKGDKLVEKATLCKMARGRMVRHLAEKGAQTPEDALDFTDLGFQYSAADSRPDTLVFIKED